MEYRVICWVDVTQHNSLYHLLERLWRLLKLLFDFLNVPRLFKAS